ncbi:MAG: FumA C-terminus/TtdB family hydratase beta subunit [Clostridiales bacterium]|jgi:fumarate hydratase subunit beta|nr:FumA C-terminus/TtdB family hydratase beta subunit [Clostridiales bacterium]
MHKVAKSLKLPLDSEEIRTLRAGDMVSLTGSVLTARDAAHKKLVELIESKGALPFQLEGQAVFYAGPCPAPPGFEVGSIGPTTSARMDAYSPFLMRHGIKVMIGKGPRSREVKEAIAEFGGLYLIAVGGIAALMSRRVKKSEVLAFQELGAEAVRWLEIESMPLVVGVDSYGRDVYEMRGGGWGEGG